MNWKHAAINNQQITNSRFLLLDSWGEIKTQLSCRLVWHFVYSIIRIMYHQCIIFLSSRNSKSQFLFEQPVTFNPSSLKPDNLKETFSIHPLLLILFRVFQFAWNPAKNWPRSQLVIPSKFSCTHWKIMNSQSHFCFFYLFICQSISSFVSFTLFSLIDFFFVQCYHQRYQVLLLRLP